MGVKTKLLGLLCLLLTSQPLQNLRKLLSRIRKWLPELEVTRKQVAFPTETAVPEHPDWSWVKIRLASTTILLGHCFHWRQFPHITQTRRVFRNRLHVRFRE